MDALALIYDAPAACPAEQELRAEVLARAPDARGRADQTFSVRITGGARLEGRLTILDKGAEATRTLQSATCAELVHALALAIATALEPEEPVAPGPAPNGAAPSGAGPRAVEEDVSLPRGPLTAPPPPRSSPRHFALGAGVGGGSGLGPLLAPELTLFAEHAWGARALRGALAASLGGPIPAGDAHGVLRRGVVRVDGCPVAWELGPLVPSICGTAEAGLVWASGANDPGAESVLRPWAAAGGAARVRLVSPGGAFFAELEGRVAFPFWHDQFYFRPSTDIYTVPPVTISLSAGAGLRFW